MCSSDLFPSHDNKYQPIQTDEICSYINQSKFKLTKQLLFEQSLTVLENKEDILPLRKLESLKIACLSIGSTDTSAFQKMLANYTQVDPFCISKNATESEITQVINQLKPYNLVIAGINGMSMYPGKRFNITDQQIRIAELLDSTKTIGVFFGNPYALSNFPGLKTKRALVVAFQHDIVAEETAAQLIFGAIDAKGKLPVSVKNMYPAHIVTKLPAGPTKPSPGPTPPKQVTAPPIDSRKPIPDIAFTPF